MYFSLMNKNREMSGVSGCQCDPIYSIDKRFLYHQGFLSAVPSLRSGDGMPIPSVKSWATKVEYLAENG